VEAKREEMIEAIANVDDVVGDIFLNEETPTEQQLADGIKKGVLDLTLTPVFMGSAYKNKGVQPLLNGVQDYLPNPKQVVNKAHDLNNEEKELVVDCDPTKPLVGLAFKLDESQYGQLTYFR